MTRDPCPRCLPLVESGRIRAEGLQPLPEGARAPLAQDGSGKCCRDCASADTLIAMGVFSEDSFEQARVTVLADRQESIRLPGVPIGLCLRGIVRMSEEGEFESHLEWLDEVLGPDWADIYS
jgi:hypothetical protein